MKYDSKILVAGANGMVGSAIVRNLKEKGYTNIIKGTRYSVDFTDQEITDEYIESTHRLSHQIGPEMTLVLEVNEQALFHFTERPLTTQQEIKKIRGTNLYRVSALVPDTFYLRPFLLSMRSNVTVLEPVELRNRLAQELTQMVANYNGKK